MKANVATYQAVAVTNSNGGSLYVRNVTNIHAVAFQRFGVRAIGFLPLHLGSGSHQARVVVQTQVKLPAEDGDVVVESLWRASSRLMVGVVGRCRVSSPAPTDLSICWTNRYRMGQEAAFCISKNGLHQSIVPQNVLQGICIELHTKIVSQTAHIGCSASASIINVTRLHGDFHVMFAETMVLLIKFKFRCVYVDT